MNLKELIQEFGKKNETVKSLKKETDAYNKQIKTIMKDNKLDNVCTDEFSAKYSTISKSSFDEDKLLTTIRTLGNLDVIKTKEYVDMDELENAIYMGKIKASDLKDCKITKIEEKLVVSKIKK